MRNIKNNSIRIGLLAVFVLIVACAPAAQTTDTNASKAMAVIPVIKFEDIELTDVIENLARQAELNYIFDPKTALDRVTEWHQKKQPRISLSWTNLTAQQSLKAVLAYYGLHLVEIKGTTVSKITLTNQTTKAVSTRWIEQGTNAIIPLIQMGTVPLEDALHNLARQAQLNLTVAPVKPSPTSTSGQGSIQLTLSFRWQSITDRQAIAALCENYDLVVSFDEPTDTIRISPRNQSN